MIFFRVYKRYEFKTEKTYETFDKETIYERLSSCLIARYINHAPWIKRVYSCSNYDGTYTYKFYGDNDMLYIFCVER